MIVTSVNLIRTTKRAASDVFLFPMLSARCPDADSIDLKASLNDAYVVIQHGRVQAVRG